RRVRPTACDTESPRRTRTWPRRNTWDTGVTCSAALRIRRAVSAAFDADVPYVVALVALAEGPVLMTNLVESPWEQIVIGAAVELTFERRSDTINLPQFRLVERTR
ncbi:MAG: Zn-ribbon domain-containing OB-fold protein, partial [Pseudomonadales bacterium]